MTVNLGLTNAQPPLEANHWVRAAALDQLQAEGQLLVHLHQRTILLVWSQGQISAIDNRCPHMGFPLQGSICKEGILTCPWHYARFDLASGGTFDAWADDVRSFPVQVRDHDIWLDLAPQVDPQQHQRQRLQDGLEQNIPLVIAKSVMGLLDLAVEPEVAFQTGLIFGATYNKMGWDTGLSIATCLMNLLTYLDPDDRPRALYQGLAAIARDSNTAPPHFRVHPLPQTHGDFSSLKAWFRQFIDQRDQEAAERCIVTAVQLGLRPAQMAEILFAAATDHRYLDTGHILDFINKAFEALDHIGWQAADTVLTSLVSGLARATRMEEASAWRYPIDLVALLDTAFEQLPAAIAAGQSQAGWQPTEALITILLGDDATAIVNQLLQALRLGCSQVQLAETVTYAAALRVARFNTNNDHGDWDNAHHPFTFANAVYQGLKRTPTIELLRGVFDAAIAVYLNRFLNVPPARLPNSTDRVADPAALLNQLPELLDRQQQVDAVGQLVARYLYSEGDPARLMASLTQLMLRENRDFHVIQSMEAAFQLYKASDRPERVYALVAAARYLAAHAPTMRSQAQTYQIAHRLHRGDRLFEEAKSSN